MKTIKVDKVVLYYMDRVDPDGNLYRFYMYKGMASEIEYGNYDFDGSYYDEIDEFIDKKLGTI